MKNAKTYETPMKKFLAQLPRRRRPQAQEPMDILLESILQADATLAQAQAALETLRQEYVDLNDLRVSPPREIAEIIGEDYPRARDKAAMVTTVLSNLMESAGALSLESLRELPKRELRRRLTEMGLDPFASAAVVLRVFAGHAVPVDASVVDALQAEGMVHASSGVEDVQGFLERIVSQKDAPEVHEALRAYVEKQPKVLSRHRHSAPASTEEPAASMANQPPPQPPPFQPPPPDAHGRAKAKPAAKPHPSRRPAPGKAAKKG